MNCDQCGAPLRWNGQQSVITCEYCLSVRALPAAQLQDRLAPLAEAGRSDCPRCAERLTRGALDGCPVEYCLSCHGILFEGPLFGHIVRTRRADFAGADAAIKPVNPHELARNVPCPGCRRSMEVHPYYGPGNVVIDSCAACALVWLDAGEMAQIERAPGRR